MRSSYAVFSHFWVEQSLRYSFCYCDSSPSTVTHRDRNREYQESAVRDESLTVSYKASAQSVCGRGEWWWFGGRTSLWNTFPLIQCLELSYQFSFFFFPFIFISWKLIILQYCSGLCHTLTWISHGVTCIPHPDPPSHLPLHPIALGLPSAPGPSTCLMHPTWAGDLFHPW